MDRDWRGRRGSPHDLPNSALRTFLSCVSDCTQRTSNHNGSHTGKRDAIVLSCQEPSAILSNAIEPSGSMFGWGASHALLRGQRGVEAPRCLYFYQTKVQKARNLIDCVLNFR